MTTVTSERDLELDGMVSEAGSWIEFHPDDFRYHWNFVDDYIGLEFYKRLKDQYRSLAWTICRCDGAVSGFAVEAERASETENSAGASVHKVLAEWKSIRHIHEVASVWRSLFIHQFKEALLLAHALFTQEADRDRPFGEPKTSDYMFEPGRLGDRWVIRTRFEAGKFNQT